MIIFKVVLDCFSNKDGLVDVEYTITSNDSDVKSLNFGDEQAQFTYAMRIAKNRAEKNCYTVRKVIRVELIAD